MLANEGHSIFWRESFMKKLFVLALAALAGSCLLAGTASARHGWGTGGDSAFAATSIYDLRQYGQVGGNSAITGHPVTNDTLRFSGKIVTALDTKPGTFG